MEKTCPRCEETLPASAFYRNVGRYDGLSGYCVECQRKSEVLSIQAMRLQALATLGGECARCHIDDTRVLVIDHIEGGGTEERRAGVVSRVLYRKVIKDPTPFQALCWNCNHLKRLDQGEHVGQRVYLRTIPGGV